MAVAISYVPAIHQGYLKFLHTYKPEKLYILGKAFVQETPRMERDIRAMEPKLVANMLQALKLCEVRVLDTEKDLMQLEGQAIILPDEDVNRTFLSNHLASYRDVKLVSVFLRWDRPISTTEFEVPPNRVISRDDFDKEMVALAHKDAQRSADWWRQVGAVLAMDSRPILIGHNRPLMSEDYTVNIFGDPRSNFDYGEYIELGKTIHAEAGLIGEAAKRGLPLNGASMYVSTFPCPVCAKLIAAAGIKAVYYDQGYSLLDAEDIFKAHDIEIILVKNEEPSVATTQTEVGQVESLFHLI
jgi:dCMP deaminase